MQLYWGALIPSHEKASQECPERCGSQRTIKARYHYKTGETTACPRNPVGVYYALARTLPEASMFACGNISPLLSRIKLILRHFKTTLCHPIPPAPPQCTLPAQVPQNSETRCAQFTNKLIIKGKISGIPLAITTNEGQCFTQYKK